MSAIEDIDVDVCEFRVDGKGTNGCMSISLPAVELGGILCQYSADQVAASLSDEVKEIVLSEALYGRMSDAQKRAWRKTCNED